MRIIVEKKEMFEKLVSGINKLSDVCGGTLGPNGRNVLINNKSGQPNVTNDGITVANAFELEDPIENLGMMMVRSVSSKTCDQAGDGTTTSIILSASMLNEAVKHIDNGCNPLDIKKGMYIANDAVRDYVKGNAITVENRDQVFDIARISGNNDDKIGKIISDIYDKIGGEGIITIERTHTDEPYVDIHEGYKIDKGFSNSAFINDKEKQQVKYSGTTMVFIATDGLSSYELVLPLIEQCKKDNVPLIILAEDVDPTLYTIYSNNKELKMCISGLPSYGDMQKEYIDDICIMTNAQHDKSGKFFVGVCDGFISTKDFTTMVIKNADEDKVRERINILKAQLDPKKPKFHNIIMSERIGRMAGKIAIIYVGAKSMIERGELYDRFEDSVQATKAALSEGILPGGGYTFCKMNRDLKIKDKNSDVQAGIDVVINALLSPFKVLCDNSGVDNVQILNKMRRTKFGYNAKTKKMVDMISDGVIDPAKVIRLSVENSVSVVSTIITTETLIF